MHFKRGGTTSMEIVDAILYKKINDGDMWNINRPQGTTPGGGGQSYINLSIDPKKLEKFMKFASTITPKPTADDRNEYTVEVKSIHDFSKIEILTFDPRGGGRSDCRITEQALYQKRHPAWQPTETGFPTINANAISASTVTTATNLKIFIVRTTAGNYYAGYINEATRPTNWPNSDFLNTMFTNANGIIFRKPSTLSVESQKLFDQMLDNTNLLLYGPPGTGKTYAMQNIWKELNNEIGNGPELYINENMNEPFIIDSDIQDLTKIRTEFLTFHQNFNYEEFVIGRRINPIAGGGFDLQPKLGVFLDVATSIEPLKEYEMAIIFIDELNRGNVSRIFGQMITFLESDKRATLSTGEVNDMKLPVPLPELTYSANLTEHVLSMNGNKIQLPSPYYLPYPIYIIASMNSVDRAVAPLDSALARRFKKVEYGVDYELLRKCYNIEETSIDIMDPDNWDAFTTAYLLLKKINNLIANHFGKDFELGHVHILSLRNYADEDSRFQKLRDSWEGTIFPQMTTLFSNRPELIHEFLKLNATDKPSNYPYQYRTTNNGETLDILETSNTFDIKDITDLKETLRFLVK